MPSNKKSEIVITCNSQQPKAAVRAMKVELDKLTKSYEQLNAAGKAGTERAKNMLQDIKDLKAAIKSGEADLEKVTKVTNNLANSTMRQLKTALAQVKKEMNNTSENSKKLDSLRQKYKAINDQIKVLEGTYVNIGKHINDLSARTDSWLSKAISQQKTHIASIDKQNKEYQNQMAILQKLEAEEARRAALRVNTNYTNALNTMNTSGIAGMSAAQLRDARSALIAKRDSLNTANHAQDIANINKLLKETELQLDKISGKEKEAVPTTREVAKSVNDLTKNLNKATPEQLRKGLEQCRAQLDQMGSGDKRRKAWVQWANQLEAALKNVDKEAVDIKKVMANLKSTPLEKLKQAAQQLEKEIAGMTRNTTDFTNKQKQLAAVRAEIQKTTGAVQQQSSAWGTTLRNMTAYFGAFQMFSIAIRKVTQVFKDNFAFSDQLADIRKVSGLAMKDIDELAVRLAKLDTRSTIQDLNQIAYAGAKLGMAKYGIEGLEGFTRAANQVNVALKEDLGADALTALSKITEVMGLIPKMGVEQSMLATGSAMFQLAATSTATAGNIVEFSKRLTGMARTAGITTDQLLGLGSAADSMFLMPEVASTAFNKFITSLQTKHNLIENELSIEPGTINKLYSAGRIVDAMVLVFEKMREKGNMNALQSVFKDLGSEGARLVNVMVTMSKNVDMLKEHLATSEEAFTEATAVSKEYAIQQQTANALMERAGNIWEKAFVNPEGVDMVKSMAQAWYDLSQSMTSNRVSMGIMKGLLALIAGELKILLALLPAILAGLMFKGAVSAITAVATSIGLMGQNAVLATLRTNGLVAAWRALNVAQKANVIGLVISLLASLAIGLASVISKTQKAAKYMEGFTTDMGDFNREFAVANARLDRFKKAIDEAGEGTRQRHAAIRNFNKEYGQYLSKMLTEKSTADQVAAAYKEVVKQMRAKIALQMKEKDIEKQVAPRIGWSADRLTEYGEQAGGSEYNAAWLKAYVDDMREAGKSLEEINNDLAKKFGVGSAVAADAYRKRSSKSPLTWTNQQGINADIRNRNMDDAGEVQETIQNNIRQLTQGERMLYAATRYAAQSFSAANAMQRVNKKWEPFNEELTTVVDESPGTLDNEAPDKDAEKKRKAEEAARRKALRAEMKEEQEKAKAIIDNVRNYYERQIAAITEMATNGGMDPQLQKKLVDGMTVRMNSALANVRQAIAGTENEWQSFRETMIQDLYEPLGADGTNQSTDLLDNIVHNDIDQLKKMIETLSKELGQNGSVLLDQIWRKATENELKNAQIENKAFLERQKLLLEKNYTGKVNKDYEGQMEQLGVAELTADQTQDLMAMSKSGDTAGIQQFVDARSKMWQDAFLKARENMVQIFSLDVSEEDGQKAMLTLLFGADYEQTLSGSALASMLNMDLSQWQVFYQKLIEMSDAYTDAQKKAYDEAKRRADFVFANRTDVQQIDTTTQSLTNESSYQQRFETDKSVPQQMGLTWDIENDPEIMRYRLLAERARLYYDEMAKLREQDKISEQQLTDAKKQLMDAQNAMADKVAAKFQERIGLLQSFSEPLATFAEGAGEYLGNMIADTEDSNVKLKDLGKQMLKAYAKMTIQMIAEDLTRRVKKQLYYRQEEADETQHQATMLQIQEAFATIMQTTQATSDATRLAQHQASNATELTEEASATTGKVSLGIAGGAAKIIGTLGFWGIPLIAVISALLMGLLSWAISAALGGSDSGAEAAGQNVKLATGMLTYDAGNAQSFAGDGQGQTQTVVGNDGNVYQARPVDKLQTGLVTKPIATLVNGQPSLVAEKGPEMVIGRETTAAMMMNRPDLMAEIVKFDKNRSGMQYRAYDEGNVSEFGDTDIAAAAPSLSQEDIGQLRDAITGFTAIMEVIQKNGLHVNKYGRGGITDEAADGAKFMGRYSGSRLWQKKS